jgi:putative peptidoglycan lipid II flippase
VTVGLVVFREPFVRFLFERGAFTADSTQLTANPLLFYSLALLPFALEVIVVQFFFARQDTLTPVLTDVGAFVLNVAFIPLFMPVFGLGGIALAAALSKALKVLALLAIFARRVPSFRLGALGPFAAQMTGASLAMLLLLGVLLVAGQNLTNGGFVQQLAYLAIAAAVGGTAFFATAYLLKVTELRTLWQQRGEWRQSLLQVLRAQEQ